jgi:vancomycin aglycone glucosyltransferase
LRQDPGRAVESLTEAEARTFKNGRANLRASLSTYESRGDVEPMVGLAVQLRALGAELRVCTPPAAEECDAPVATGVMPTGGWR